MIASRFGLLAVSLALGLAPALANAQSSADLIATLRNARIIDLSHLWERT